MRVIRLRGREDVYSSNVHLVLGDWSGMEDVNTLVDVGRDPAVIKSIDEAPTGVGKRKVDQVVLTHSHFDHAELLPVIRELFQPAVYAYSPAVEGVDHLLSDGDSLVLGDRTFEVIHTPGHTDDSICLYGERDGVLFVGDAPLLINSVDGTYQAGFIRALERLCSKRIRRIYFGHGKPLLEGCDARLRASLRNVQESMKLSSGVGKSF